MDTGWIIRTRSLPFSPNTPVHRVGASQPAMQYVCQHDVDSLVIHAHLFGHQWISTKVQAFQSTDEIDCHHNPFLSYHTCAFLVQHLGLSVCFFLPWLLYLLFMPLHYLIFHICPSTLMVWCQIFFLNQNKLFWFLTSKAMVAIIATSKSTDSIDELKAT